MSNQNNKTLGRGLSSLINDNAQSRTPASAVQAPYFPKINKGVSNQILDLDIDKIKANPHQPRKEFHETPMNDLILSIKEHGVIQPLIVTQTMSGNYELIAGERRLRAAKKAGLTQVPVIVRTAKDLEKLEISLIENIQRQDLNPIEKAVNYKKLVEEFNISHEDAARRLGISRAQFSNLLRLLTLPQDIQQGLANSKISLGQAKILLELKDDKSREQIFKRARQTGMTVEDTKKEVKKVKRLDSKNQHNNYRQIKKDPQLKEWESQMQEKLNTKVSIRKRGQFGGVVEVEFYSEEELREIINKIIQS